MSRAYQYSEDFKVTDQMKNDYEEGGYIIIKGLLDVEELNNIKKAVECKNDLTDSAYGLPDGENGYSRLALWSHPGNDVTGMLVRTEKLAGTAEQLLGGEVYHYHTKLMMKNPKTGGRHVWHQDYGYWYKNGCLFPDMLSVFLPIDKCIKENGCLEILDGSHKCGRIEHLMVAGQTGADMERVKELQKVFPHKYVELDAGDALFFHCNLLHTSAPNHSDMRRWVFIPAYNKASNNPVYEHHHPQYTKLHKVPNSAIRECRNYTDMTGKEFIDTSKDKTVAAVKRD
ncbi:hypothetical protein LOTGIDRAFT_223496 [Lottia gigantea]|uniref:Fe2OG dioxygenase domain-containing protein n=1 Tax=Lottia gigantea TaxID=225164 RepID=V3ZIH8_LOTGI|nr:hypothetical protein LOTGIDRAFT_223496 [Lottia gigantea]ESO82125.1 hypothetical protein LOTGIDRAFT_223496 [Lottia gigantea]